MRSARLRLAARRASALALALALAASAGGAAARAPLPAQPPGTPWPTLAWPRAAPRGTDAPALEAALAALFEPVGRGGLPDTRALLVVQGGRVVVERYAPGFGPDSRFQSWSMAKSVTLALVGILVRQGRLALDAPAPVPAWRAPDDPRRAVTLRELLEMTSGLDNADGGQSAGSFVARLLFGPLSADTAASAAAVPLAHPPGSHWAYSTATTSIVSGIVRRSVGGTRAATLDFVRSQLASPLGLASLVPEFDAAGTLLGGASVWASARDWARLGLLFLRDGVWEERRILPEGWVDFARTPAPAANNGTFGAHLWINAEPGPGQFRPLPGAPASAFLMSGNAGQYVAMLPDRDLVVVRLGEMQATDWPTLGRRVAAVAAAFPVPARGAGAP
jgi:CubicO group peptidase (beta-lactamase class C family)